ncbi:MAG: ComEC/Rec2 family competence protein [Actinomycetaceae bacterium]|nr:ComEC/Rec2 family competence protein [Arcanobacterium sp.]MDD7505254.1 ComEC/Rec2 family competence protein [Actinomycetaceae bacterium]MDY6144017.1 ComEC/Rec2 family competence protein [Arcanobacterium sp.]
MAVHQDYRLLPSAAACLGANLLIASHMTYGGDSGCLAVAFAVVVTLAGICAVILLRFAVFPLIRGVLAQAIAVWMALIALLSVRIGYETAGVTIPMRFSASHYEPPEIPVLSSYTEQIRVRFTQHASDSVIPEWELLRGIVIGDDAGLSQELTSAMRSVSLTHLTAVSGAHVSILLSMVIMLCGIRRRRMTAACGALAIVFLVSLVGMHPSVLRASLMGILMVLAVFMRRQTTALPLLCVVVIGVSIVVPELSTSLGFLLSVAATGGIVMFSARAAHAMTPIMPLMAAQAIAVPGVAQIAVTPFLADIQDSVSPWGVVANIAVAPVIAPMTILGLLGAVASGLPLCGALASIALDVASIGAKWISFVSTRIAMWPPGHLDIWTVTVINCCSLLCLIGIACAVARFGERASKPTDRRIIAPWRVNRVHLYAVLSAGLLGIGLYAIGSILNDNGGTPDDWEIIQCDVGQGAGLLARARGETVLIDVGQEPHKIETCLSKAGVERIELLILSHFDTDHVEALDTVVQYADVGSVWVSPNPYPLANSKRVYAHLARRGIPLHRVQEGATHNGWIEILSPRHPRGSEDASNSDSLVVSASTEHHRLLALADTPEEIQSQLATGANRYDVVAVAHHGSADQSATLASRVSPTIALFSVGENSYGHPTPRAIELWHASFMYSTMRCGTITITAEEVFSSCNAQRSVK